MEFVCALWRTSVAVNLSHLKQTRGKVAGTLVFSVGLCFCGLVDQEHSNTAVFSLGLSVGLMSHCRLLFVARGVVTLMAGPLEPSVRGPRVSS